eukprot:jgi/Psemu1/9823/gm1.9823_g
MHNCIIICIRICIRIRIRTIHASRVSAEPGLLLPTHPNPHPHPYPHTKSNISSNISSNSRTKSKSNSDSDSKTMRNPFPVSIAPRPKPRLLWEKSSSSGVTLDTTFHSICNSSGSGNSNTTTNNNNNTNTNNNNTNNASFATVTESDLNEFAGLASSAPSTISFVVRFPPFDADATATAPTGSNYSNSNNDNDSGTRRLRDLIGIPLAVNHDTNRFEVVAGCEPSESSSSSSSSSSLVPLLPLSLAILLQPGDVLESIDGVPIVVTGAARNANTNTNTSNANTSNANTANNTNTTNNRHRLGRRFPNLHAPLPLPLPLPWPCLSFDGEEDLCEYQRVRVSPRKNGPAANDNDNDNDNGENADGTEFCTITLTFACGSREATTTTIGELGADPAACGNGKGNSKGNADAPSRRPVHHAYLVNHRGTSRDDSKSRSNSNSNSNDDDEDDDDDPFLQLDAVVEEITVQPTTHKEEEEDPPLPEVITTTTNTSSNNNNNNSNNNSNNNNGTSKADLRNETGDEDSHRGCRSLFLRIRSIPSDSWLCHQNHIRAGDVLVSVNDAPTTAITTATNANANANTNTNTNAGCSTEDLSGIWTAALRSAAEETPGCTVVLLAAAAAGGFSSSSLSPSAPRAWSSRLRRAAVTAGGSALVGTGAVLMVTPLHPVGHAMALGGLGVLGTEFEAPRTALDGVRRSWTRVRERRKQDRQQKLEGSESDDDNDDNDNDNDVAGANRDSDFAPEDCVD